MKVGKLKWLTVLGCALLFAMGCTNQELDLPDESAGAMGEVSASLSAAQALFNKKDAKGENVLVAFYVPGKTDYTDRTAYTWVGDGADCKDTMKTEEVTLEDGTKYTFGYMDLSSAAGVPSDVSAAFKDGKDVKIIIKSPGAWEWQTPDLMLPISSGDKHFMITSGEETKSDSIVDSIGTGEIKPAIRSAVSESGTKIRSVLSVTLALDTSVSDNGFIIKSKTEGVSAIKVVDVQNADSMDDRYRNVARNIIITTDKALDAQYEWTLERDGFVSADISMQNAGKEFAAQHEYKDYVDGDEKATLGLTLDGNKGTFKVWAPIASDVKLLVYNTAADVIGKNAKGEDPDRDSVVSTTDVALKGSPASNPITMTKDQNTGVWVCTLDNATSYKYYKYQIVNNGTTYYVCDINAKAASPDAIATQIVDINSGTDYGKKEKYKNPFTKSYTEAVIYEMHITDWSYAENSSTDDVGKYLTIANGTKVIKHLNDLGVTHVQLLPVFEFAETNKNTNYNWGYNPYHYNVPEGRYVVDMTDGMDAVVQLRTLIEAFHDANIAVNMDVVYNHTNGTQGGSLYDSTVPYYYYRFDSAGNYSNGSGCGNEIDTEAPMMKRYIIDSLKHWMLDYHINGFRFDLMGCISKSTMEEIYDELKKIDPKVMVYGEPWTGGTAAVNDGAVQAVADGVGAFDDDFRDAIKGAEFGGFKKGQVQGTFNDEGILLGLCGKSGNNKRNETDKIGLALHYVECHDNYTLFDKIAMSYLNRISFNGNLFERLSGANYEITNADNTKTTINALNEVKKQDKLAAAYVFLSQGTAFLNGGQEFLRTKKGNENSYNTNASKTNSIDLSFKTEYSDVYNTYKGLIALRKANPEAFGSNKDAKAETVKDADGKNINGVTKYTTGNFLVYFNATDEAVDITTTGYTKAVDVSSGTPTESATLPATVAAKSFVILKK